jgi:hypothetical protein
LREAARVEREFEEQRLKKRLERERAAPAGTAGSRAASVIPGTPGSAAPEPVEKAPTKKEMSKKKAATAQSDADNHKLANATTATMLGTGGRGMFGKKKTYGWMQQGAGSGSSTPAMIMAEKARGVSVTPAPVEPVPEPKLTGNAARRLGEWRDNGEKGRGVQMRDWVTALELDGRDKQALQRAYTMLDDAGPK